METLERIDYFLCSARRTGQSFQSMASCYVAVQNANEQIPFLLLAQDRWILKEKAIREIEKKERTKNDLMDPDNYSLMMMVTILTHCMSSHL